MKDHPIIFSGPMVRALLSGSKTMTRRLAWKSETDTKKMAFLCDGERGDRRRIARNVGVQMAGAYYLCATPWQKVKPGDRLWVRESLEKGKSGFNWQYAADTTPIMVNRSDPRTAGMIAWAHHQERDSTPSMFMPRWASRLTLIVTATKIERLQDISEDDAHAEGVNAISMIDVKRQAAWSARGDFAQLWEKLHGTGSWASNPEVVAIAFIVHKTNIDTMPKTEAA